MSYKDGYEKRAMVVGPWGGQGGTPWDDGVYTTVRQLVIVHGAAIHSIQIEYDLKGSSVWSDEHAGSSGAKTDKVKLDHPEEVLTSVSGYYGALSNGSAVVVRSLTFESNRCLYGPFGFEQGTHFSVPLSGCRIVGFYGRSGWHLDCLGVYLRQIRAPSSSKEVIPSQSLTMGSNDRAGYNFVEGNVGRGYDIVFAVKERGDNLNLMAPYNGSTYASEVSLPQEFRNMDFRNKMVAYPSYSTAERGSPILRGPVTYGPWGGSSGTIFDDGIYTGIRQINIARNAGITSIKVQYDRDGQSVWGNKHGGSGGIMSDKIIFDFPFEILTYITGYFGPTLLMGPTAIKSLTFHTTKRKYGPYGEEQGISFSSGLADGMIVGIHGRSGWYIHSIGVHVLEGKVSVPQTSSDSITKMDSPQWSDNKLAFTGRNIGEEVIYGVLKEPVPSGPGSWGGEGGQPWDDGVHTGIRQIFITRDEAICSIQIEYDRSGQSVWSMRHGSAGELTQRIKFEYPNELLNGISGYYDTISRDGRSKVVKSLTFFSTKGKYGPFGEETGTYFTSARIEGKVVGFHGRSGLYLDAIGVHMQHWLVNKKSSTRSMLSRMLF